MASSRGFALKALVGLVLTVSMTIGDNDAAPAFGDRTAPLDKQSADVVHQFRPSSPQPSQARRVATSPSLGAPRRQQPSPSLATVGRRRSSTPVGNNQGRRGRPTTRTRTSRRRQQRRPSEGRAERNVVPSRPAAKIQARKFEVGDGDDDDEVDESTMMYVPILAAAAPSANRYRSASQKPAAGAPAPAVAEKSPSPSPPRDGFRRGRTDGRPSARAISPARYEARSFGASSPAEKFAVAENREAITIVPAPDLSRGRHRGHRALHFVAAAVPIAAPAAAHPASHASENNNDAFFASDAGDSSQVLSLSADDHVRRAVDEAPAPALARRPSAAVLAVAAEDDDALFFDEQDDDEPDDEPSWVQPIFGRNARKLERSFYDLDPETSRYFSPPSDDELAVLFDDRASHSDRPVYHAGSPASSSSRHRVVTSSAGTPIYVSKASASATATGASSSVLTPVGRHRHQEQQRQQQRGRGYPYPVDDVQPITYPAAVEPLPLEQVVVVPPATYDDDRRKGSGYRGAARRPAAAAYAQPQHFDEPEPVYAKQRPAVHFDPYENNEFAADGGFGAPAPATASSSFGSGTGAADFGPSSPSSGHGGNDLASTEYVPPLDYHVPAPAYGNEVAYGAESGNHGAFSYYVDIPVGCSGAYC